MFAALRSLVGADTAFPYEVGDEVPVGTSGEAEVVPWALHNAVKKVDGTPVSVFALELSAVSPDQLKAARLAARRLKTLRHPCVLRYVDSTETATHLYIVTCRVTPLANALEEDRNDHAISWGIHQIAKALAFLVAQSMVHRNVCLASVFVDKSGEWLLSGMELTESDRDAPGEGPPASLSPPRKYLPPEATKSTRSHAWSRDMWGLGCLMWEVYNGELPGPEKLKAIKSIPKTLVPHWASLVSAKPMSRPAPEKFIANARQQGNYLCNRFVDTNLFLEEITLKEKEDTINFFKALPEVMDQFPKAFCVHKILPQLLNAFQYAGAGSQVLAPLLKIGKQLEPDEFQTQILPCVVKLFSSTDRATRISLLQQLEHFVEYLTEPVASNEIFPSLASGFSDTVPAMREQTLRSMLLLAPKLNVSVIDGQMLRHFAKLQMDEQPGIRTNTTVCLGKLAPNLGAATRKKVLIPAFLRALKDPFPHARSAGLMALSATQQYYTSHDCATKILPALVTLTVDTEENVREQAFSAVRLLLRKVESAHNGEEQPAEDDEGHQTALTAASSWAGWAGSAVSGLSSTLSKAAAAAKAAQASAKAAQAPGTAKGKQQSPATTRASQVVQSRQDRPSGGDNDSSDYGDEWEDVDGKGSAKQSPKQSPKHSSSSSKSKAGNNDGWGDDGDDGWGDDNTDGWGDDDDDLDISQGSNAVSVTASPVSKPSVTSAPKAKAAKGLSKSAGGGMKLKGNLSAKPVRKPKDDVLGELLAEDAALASKKVAGSSLVAGASASASTTDGWGDDSDGGWGDEGNSLDLGDDGQGNVSEDDWSTGWDTPKTQPAPKRSAKVAATKAKPAAKPSPPAAKTSATTKPADNDDWGGGWGDADDNATAAAAPVPKKPTAVTGKTAEQRAAERAARMEAAKKRREAARAGGSAGGAARSPRRPQKGLGAIHKKV